MIETATIITLFILWIVFFRPGKTPPLNNPLVIQRAGQYHISLAAQLNLAQPYIEGIVNHLADARAAPGNSTTQFFSVRDKHVTAHGHDYYLLAATLRDGVLYFQADSPPADNKMAALPTLHEFSRGVLQRHPSTGDHDAALDQRIISAVLEVAQQRSIEVMPLTA